MRSRADRHYKPHDGGWASDLEMQADLMLDAAARSEGVLVRDWGILDHRRQQHITMNRETSLENILEWREKNLEQY